VDGFTPNLAM